MTGKPDMSTDAMREYFLPLEKWLKKENKKNGVRVGWDHDDSKVMCSDQTSGQTTDQTSSSETTDQTSGEITTDETPAEITTETLGVTTDPSLEETTNETTETPNLTDNSCEDVTGKWKNCLSWGKRGYCTIYFMEPYMKKNCRKTCGFC